MRELQKQVVLGDGQVPMSSMQRGAWILILPLWAWLSSGCISPSGRQDAEPIRFANLGAEYVGDLACFDCHEGQWRGFQEHGMARSFYPLTQENVIEDFRAAPLFHEGSGFYYQVFARGDSFFQAEYRLDASGGRTHELVRKIDYVVGSGNAARTYLTESVGRLYEMPLTWYAQSATWDFSPGYQIYNKRFGRLVPDRCMACHNSYPGSVPFVTGKYDHVPEGIGCERCHGPGSLHVAERLASPEVRDAADRTIVNPAHLSGELQMDICQQCHLHTTVSLLREGHEAFDFRPSERLEDFVALFSAPKDETEGTIDVISHAERLRLSACFVATSMTCTTCHNPHEGFRDKGPEYFDRTCASCHDGVDMTEHSGGESCIQCHMPKVPADGAPHASFTDHWIRVVGNDIPELRPAHALEAAGLAPYFERDTSGPEAERYAALAYLVHGTQLADSVLLDRGITLAGPIHAQDSSGELSFLLGVTLTNLGSAQEAIAPLRLAIERRAVPERLNGLAQALEQAEQASGEVRALYDSALVQQPALADIRINYGLFLQRQGDLQQAAVQFRLATTEMPLLAVAHTHLGTAYMQDGAFDQAEASLKRAIALEPDDSDALGNLGLMYTTMPGRNADARRLFERAATAAPGNAVAQANLGTWYLNNGNLRAAIERLTAALALAPDYLGGMINLALAHARSGNYEEARRLAVQALALDPGNNAVKQILDAL